MTKKKTKTMKKKSKKPHKDLYHLTMLLKYTERSVKGDSEELDAYFTGQASRIKKQIKDLK